MSIALPWIGLSAYMLFTNAMSSTQVARCGKSSLTHAPHWPCCLNFHFGPTTRPSLRSPHRPLVLTLIVWPSNLESSGL